MPVDLTPLFPGDPERDPAARHGAALRWFLLSLHAGRPTDPLGWTTTTTVAHEPGLPPLLQSSGPLPRAERYSPDMRPAAPTATTPAQELCATAEVWRHNRGLYPGWLVAPQPVRERLWDRTREWMQAFATHREQLAPATQLHVLFELNWRLEAALLPIWSELLPAYPIVLGLVNPFPSALGDLPDTVLRPSAADGADLEWGSVRVQWLGVAFGLIRHYREERLAAEFEVSGKDTDPRGLEVVGADGETGGTVVDLWVDKAESLFRYLEVQTPGGRRVLLPMNFARVRKDRVAVRAILGRQFEAVPAIRDASQVTLLEEEKVMAYFGAGLLYAEPSRVDPLF